MGCFSHKIQFTINKKTGTATTKLTWSPLLFVEPDFSLPICSGQQAGKGHVFKFCNFIFQFVFFQNAPSFD